METTPPVPRGNTNLHWIARNYPTYHRMVAPRPSITCAALSILPSCDDVSDAQRLETVEIVLDELENRHNMYLQVELFRFVETIPRIIGSPDNIITLHRLITSALKCLRTSAAIGFSELRWMLSGVVTAVPPPGRSFIVADFVPASRRVDIRTACLAIYPELDEPNQQDCAEVLRLIGADVEYAPPAHVDWQSISAEQKE